MKKIITTLILFIIFITNTNALDLDINSKYAYCYNLTEDKVMYEKNSDDKILVASMTKIMTAILVIENNQNLEEIITIKDEDLKDWAEYTTTGFQNGDQVTIKELLYGILLKSGSDAVNAAVRITTDTEEKFIELMNQKVKELGLINTHFSNAIGKDEDNYSSVSDIAKIMQYCLKNDTFKEIISTNMYYIDNLNIQVNGPLYKSETKYDVDTNIITGAKTGYTLKAQHSMVSFSTKDGITYILVTAYADNYTNLLTDAIYIYNYFYDNYKYIDYNINFDINIKDGKEKIYNVDLNTKLFLNNNYEKNNITYKYDGANEINFLYKKNSKLGEISIYYNDELIKTVDVKLNKNLEFKSKVYIKLTSVIIITIVVILMALFNKNIIKKLKRVKKKNNKEEIIKPIKEFIKEEDSINTKLYIIKNTTDINMFFDSLKKINYTNNDKEKFEHDFIDRCFKEIDFSNEDNLRDLYIKFKLYKNEMCTSTIDYYNKLFKYCIKEYINK